MARLKTRIPQIFNVEQYGAKADGINDDSVAIQSAIDHAYSVGGGQVQLMLGNHKILSTLVMKYHVELIGHGVKKTYLTVPAGVDGINIVKLVGDSTDFHLLLRDFSLEGGGIAGAGTQRGIAFVTDGYFAHINLKRLRVIGFNGDGIQSSVALFPNQSVFVGTIEDVRVQQCSGHAFVFEVGTTLNFTACYASACRKSGFRMKSQAYGSIHDSASEECGIAFEMIGNQCFNIYSSGSELTSDYSLAYPGICLSDTGCSSCNYIGLYLQKLDNAGGGNNIRKYLKFDGSLNCNVVGLRLKADSLGVQVPNFSYEIINGAKVNLSQVTVNGLPANLAKVGSGEFRNIIASELHGSNSYSHFWRVDEQIDYQVLSADLTLTNDSPGVLHVNGGLGTRVVVLPTPTLVAPNLHGMTFSIKNIGTTNNIEVREGTPTGTLRGTLLPGEWATYRWDTNFPRYFEWK